MSYSRLCLYYTRLLCIIKKKTALLRWIDRQTCCDSIEWFPKKCVYICPVNKVCIIKGQCINKELFIICTRHRETDSAWNFIISTYTLWAHIDAQWSDCVCQDRFATIMTHSFKSAQLFPLVCIWKTRCTCSQRASIASAVVSVNPCFVLQF